ncbi:MAG: thiamine pyrophosphate-dependent dehydrogenase E1 component subunit alpha [Actinobacteria bacterium]|nr:thiamine pyrophosphate-dependent dehydrogenase E1 component subunit alpha [Actinomycetota bacterium]
MGKISKEMQIEMLKKLIEIRRFEERTVQYYQRSKIWGYLHPYIGEEAVAVGACLAIKKEDYIISTHRGHGHAIAKGADLNKMMAELFGKVTGYCRGRGGSMHIADTELGMLGANGIVGGGVPISVGAGFSCKMEKRGRVIICFFGDGAANNGVFHEAVNMSAILKLPVIYICENNMYAISMCSRESVAGNDIAGRAKGYGIPGYKVDGSDVIAVYDAVEKAVDYARKGNGPSLIEALTYRFLGHHPNDPAAYRPKDEAEREKRERDCVINFKNKLLNEKILTQAQIDEFEKDIEKKIDAAVEFAENSPEPELEKFLSEVMG